MPVPVGMQKNLSRWVLYSKIMVVEAFTFLTSEKGYTSLGNTYFTWRLSEGWLQFVYLKKKLFWEFLVLTVFHFQPRIFPFRLINKKVLTTISARCSFFVKLKLFWKKVAVLRMARFGFLNDIFSKLFLTLKKTAYTQTKKSFIWLIYLNKVTKEKRVYSN